MARAATARKTSRAPTVAPAMRKGPTQERARATVDAVLEATARVLVEEGFDKASTNRIAARAGVSVGSLYQYFDGKEALVRALAERHHEQLMGVLALAAADIADRALDDVVHDIVAAMIEAHAVDPQLHHVLTEQVPREIRTCRIEDDGATFVRGLLEVHRSKVREDLDLDVATFLLIHTVEGVTHAAVLDNPAMLQEPRFTRELARMITSYLR